MNIAHSGEDGCGDWHIQSSCIVWPAISHHTRFVSGWFLSLYMSLIIDIDIVIS